MTTDVNEAIRQIENKENITTELKGFKNPNLDSNEVELAMDPITGISLFIPIVIERGDSFVNTRNGYKFTVHDTRPMMRQFIGRNNKGEIESIEIPDKSGQEFQCWTDQMIPSGVTGSGWFRSGVLADNGYTLDYDTKPEWRIPYYRNVPTHASRYMWDKKTCHGTAGGQLVVNVLYPIVEDDGSCQIVICYLGETNIRIPMHISDLDWEEFGLDAPVFDMSDLADRNK